MDDGCAECFRSSASRLTEVGLLLLNSSGWIFSFLEGIDLCRIVAILTKYRPAQVEVEWRKMQCCLGDRIPSLCVMCGEIPRE